MYYPDGEGQEGASSRLFWLSLLHKWSLSFWMVGVLPSQCLSPTPSVCFCDTCIPVLLYERWFLFYFFFQLKWVLASSSSATLVCCHVSRSMYFFLHAGSREKDLENRFHFSLWLLFRHPSPVPWKMFPQDSYQWLLWAPADICRKKPMNQHKPP